MIIKNQLKLKDNPLFKLKSLKDSTEVSEMAHESSVKFDKHFRFLKRCISQNFGTVLRNLMIFPLLYRFPQHRPNTYNLSF